MRSVPLVALLIAFAGCTGSGDLESQTPADPGVSESGSISTVPSTTAPPAEEPPREPPQDPGNGTNPDKPLDGEPEDCQRLVAGQGTFADPAGSPSSWSERTLDVAFAVDETFLEAYGENWTARAEGLAAGLEAFYFEEVRIHVRIVHLVALPAGTLPPFVASTPLEGFDEADAIMAALKAHYNATYPGLARDAVHLLLGGDAAGSVAGQANCIGGAGYLDAGYSWAEASPEEDRALPGGAKVLQQMALKVSAHELGHVLGAHHHYANCAEAAAWYSPQDALATCTLMYNDSGLVSLGFSTPNKLAIRALADANDV